VTAAITATQALYAFRLVFVAFILWASAKTFMEGWPTGGGASPAHAGQAIRLLAGAEIVAAALFLWPTAQLWAGGVLIAIFAIATVIDLKAGGVPARFAYYSATVAVVAFLDLKLSGTAA
jgi:hypothetical protein